MVVLHTDWGNILPYVGMVYAERHRPIGHGRRLLSHYVFGIYYGLHESQREIQMKLKSAAKIKQAIGQVELESPNDGGDLEWAYKSIVKDLKHALLTLILYARDDRYRGRLEEIDTRNETKINH